MVTPSRRVKMLQLVLHLLAQLAVERAQRLVEQNQPRLEHQCAGHRDPLLLAAGELLRLAVGEACPAAPWLSARLTLDVDGPRPPRAGP